MVFRANTYTEAPFGSKPSNDRCHALQYNENINGIATQFQLSRLTERNNAQREVSGSGVARQLYNAV